MYDVCRELRLTYTFRVPAGGCGMNAVLKRESQALQDEAVARYEQTGQPQRLFLSLMYRAGTWAEPQRVVIKCEAHAQGTNRRAVVTNRPGAKVLSQPVYDEYTERGESENRNKELKCGLCADRLSDHRFMANFFRLYLHTVALNLLVRLRRAVAQKFTPHELSESSDLPTHLPAEALAGSDRRRFLQRHRDRDPLGEGHVETWRTRLIKVAAQVLVRARRIVIRLSASWPHQNHFAAVTQAVTRFATG